MTHRALSLYLPLDSRQSTPGASTGGIIGGILCVIILVAIIATTIVMVRKYQRKNIE